MKPSPKLFVLAAAVVLSASAANAVDLYVISNTGTVVSSSDIREIFLGDKQLASGIRLIPVDNASAQETFLSRYMQIGPDKYSNAWIKKSFREGVNAPPVKATDAEVLEYVRHTQGAVGYIRSPTHDGVNVVDSK
jgi:hypothetical protein